MYEATLARNRLRKDSTVPEFYRNKLVAEVSTNAPSIVPHSYLAATMTSMNDPDPRKFHLIFLLVGVAQIQFYVDFQIGLVNRLRDIPAPPGGLKAKAEQFLESTCRRCAAVM